MILRKPYAFIIKHFRAIHLIMLGCLVFLLTVARNINSLFSSLQRTSTFMYVGADAYVNKIVYVVIFILLFLCGVVFWLLREKNKPTKFYLFLIIYGVIQIISFAFVFHILTLLQESVLESEQIILGRDISIICSLPNYVFIVICFIRGIGFNLKQFNFSKDIEELEIVDKDSEEFEVLIGQNNYKYIRFLRRTIREIKYYILENKVSMIIFASIIGVFFAGYGIFYYNEYMKKLSAQETTSVEGIAYTVKNSYITNYDFNGNKISNKYKYVVVELSLYNNTDEPKAINLDKINLANGKLLYSPTLTKNEKFYDLGVPYNAGDKINSNAEKTVTLAFEIPSSVITKKFELRVEYGIDSSGRKVKSQYRKFDVSAKNIDKKVSLLKKNVNEIISTNVIEKNEFNITIMGYKLLDSYDEKYVQCSNINYCIPLSNVIKPSNASKQTMLVLDYKGNIYEDANFTKTLNNFNKIIENYLTVNYTAFNKDYAVKAKVVANSDVDGKIFVMVDRKLSSASEITLDLSFRDEKIEIPLL